MSDVGREWAVELVTRFLRLVEDRDLEGASRYLAPGANITFPGGRSFTSLEDQVASSAKRFQVVRKVFEGFDISGSNRSTVVYCFGTLNGRGLDGAAFNGIRFVDRFVLEDGLIIDQKVWNDMGEYRAGTRPSGY